VWRRLHLAQERRNIEITGKTVKIGNKTNNAAFEPAGTTINGVKITSAAVGMPRNQRGPHQGRLVMRKLFEAMRCDRGSSAQRRNLLLVVKPGRPKIHPPASIPWRAWTKRRERRGSGSSRSVRDPNQYVKKPSSTASDASTKSGPRVAKRGSQVPVDLPPEILNERRPPRRTSARPSALRAFAHRRPRGDATWWPGSAICERPIPWLIASWSWPGSSTRCPCRGATTCYHRARGRRFKPLLFEHGPGSAPRRLLRPRPRPRGRARLTGPTRQRRSLPLPQRMQAL